MPEMDKPGEKIFRGIAVSAGVCHAKLLVFGKKKDSIPAYGIKDEEAAAELARLEAALVQTRHQILEIQRKVGSALGADDASIFDAHLLILEDSTLIDEVTRMISLNRINAEQAFHLVAEKFITTLGAIDDEYLRERSSDMRDVTSRVLGNLLDRAPDEMKLLREQCILASHDLAPSATATLDRKLVLGIATEVGSKTSHTAIMARSMEIPAIVGVQNILAHIANGQDALLDGYNGLLIINPTDQTLFEYGQLVRKKVTWRENLKELFDKPAVTLDGAKITLSANVEQASDTEAVKECGAEGVGLFRTEYLFINRNELPSEDEQYQAYRQVAAALKPHPVVIRTLDLGGDKFLTQMSVPVEMNPFLGWRAIRFCLEEKDVFRSQLRAVLRASVEGNIKLMYPMISGVGELRQANALLETYKAELRSEGTLFDESLEVGIMIEIPSAALTAGSLAKHVKFFSVGTNDLIQYSLAVDRLNEKIAHLYEPTHPAILRLIKMSVEAAHANGIWTGVCGEMAGDAMFVPLLLGLGVDELSVAPPVVPQIKHLIRRLRLSDAKELADFALGCDSAAEIYERSQAFVRKAAPGLLDLEVPTH